MGTCCIKFKATSHFAWPSADQDEKPSQVEITQQLVRFLIWSAAAVLAHDAIAASERAKAACDRAAVLEAQ